MASIKKIGTELNWDIEKKAIYGNYSGFDVTLEQNISYGNSQNNFKILYIPYNDITSATAGVLNGYLKANKKELKLALFEVKQDMLIARLGEGLKGINAERLKEILQLIVSQFAQLSIETKDTCAYCNQEPVDAIAYINKIKLPSHESCKQNAIANVQAQKEKLANEPSSPLGYMGAIAGAVIGAIPFTVALLFNWYIGILSILTGVVCYEGYKLLGGKVNKTTKYILSLISFTVILATNIILAYSIVLEYDVTLNQVLNNVGAKEYLIESVGMSALFGLIGVFYVFSRIKNDEHKIEIT